MIEYVMKCERTDNEIRLTLPTNEGAKEKILQELEKIEKAGGFALVTMQKPKKPRTVGADSQNHHLNAHIMQICQETGNDYDSVKNAVKETAVQYLGYPYKQIGRRIVPLRERDSSIEECSKLIEAVHILAGELGIVLKEC